MRTPGAAEACGPALDQCAAESATTIAATKSRARGGRGILYVNARTTGIVLPRARLQGLAAAGDPGNGRG